ncbi:hypothetical protein CP533_2617 [Ophiocordyceps camponoti-saundersi (nom. inval.)]|nr:hypothetical protein CP533_2617 [Ophiocordyceps camponoti-saundersi (nom. inval.)]
MKPRLSISCTTPTFLLLATASRAVLVAPGSPCSTGCGNVLESTSADDVVCDTGAYTSSAVGQLFQGCVECEMGSGYGRGDETDVKSMLYNLRYALSYCLFGYPGNSQLGSTPCITSKACGPFREATLYGNLSTRYKGYDYCERWPISKGGDVDYKACAECLQAAENPYLANFVVALEAGCEQKPVPGVGLGTTGNIFSHDPVSVTAPSPTATLNPAWFDHGSLGLGGKVGIAVGCLAFVLILAGCAVVVNGRRRRRDYLRRLEARYGPSSSKTGEKEPASAGGRAWDDTPSSQQPLRPWDDRHLSPCSTQYNSPVSPSNTHLSLSALGIVHQPEGKGKEKEETIEMQQQQQQQQQHHFDHRIAPQSAEAPVLGHPGFGRSVDGPPRQYEADAKRTG